MTPTLMDELIRVTRTKAAEKQCKTKAALEADEHSILTYITVRIAMGFLQFPSLRDYFTTNDELQLFGSAFVSNLLSRDQLYELHRTVCFDRPAKEPDPRRPGRQRYVDQPKWMATLSDTFTNNWNPSEEVAPDELLAKYTGTNSILLFDTEQLCTQVEVC